MTNWNLTLKGGPRDGDHITTSDLLPFLVFTTGAADGTTMDHYYGPTSVDRDAMVAEYEPVESPDNALAAVWDAGYTTGNAHNGRRDANPYRRAK